MTMSRYDFLAEAHKIVKPRVYLEVGVQAGASLVLAEHAELAIGIDTEPHIQAGFVRPNQVIDARTADAHFVPPPSGTTFIPHRKIDFAFIDGSHLFEDALRDFINVEHLAAGPRSVVFFDDVLPYNQVIATREQPPGDWTGDVWKIVEILETQRSDLHLTLIDVAPTGLLMAQCEIWGTYRRHPSTEGNVLDDVLARDYDKIVASWLTTEVVPEDYVNRTHAVHADYALDLLRKGQTA